MRTRTLRTWVILAGLTAIVCAAVFPSELTQAYAGTVSLACVVTLIWMDGLTRRRRP